MRLSLANRYFAHDRSYDSAMHNLVEAHLRNALVGRETIGSAKRAATENANTG
jgi:hypothetical protein